MKRILVIGSTNIDNVATVEHHPVAGETIISRDYSQHFGGKGANQAYAAGRLGGNAAFLGAVGADGQGEAALAHLRGANVDTSAVAIIEGSPTGMAMIVVNAKGENNIVVMPGANAKLVPERIRAARRAIEAADVILLQLEIDIEGVWEAIRIADSLGKTIVLDPAPAVFIPEDILKAVTFLTPNESELKLLTGLPVDTDDEVCVAARKLLGQGVRNVLVTRGEKGSILVNKEGVAAYPSYPVRPVDTTAAGDTFNAAFGVMLANEKQSIQAAICFASAAAAVSTTRIGAQESVPAIEEVYELLNRN